MGARFRLRGDFSFSRDSAQAGLDRAALWGYSRGAGFAGMAAIEFPRRLTALILGGELTRRVVDDLGAAAIAVLGRDLVEVLLDQSEDPARARQDRLELGDQLDRLAVVVV